MENLKRKREDDKALLTEQIETQQKELAT